MKSVTITANDDGSYTVESEPQNDPEMGMPEGPENGPQDMQEDQSEGEPAQQCQTIDEALDAAKQMLGGSTAMIDGEDDFVKGFKAVKGTPDEQMMARRM